MMAFIECCDLWRRFINAEYVPKIEAKVKCQDCRLKRLCNNYYCLACKEGGLCSMKFKANQLHDHHPYLQVRQLTHENVVNVDELEAFLGANAHKIQKFIGNNKDTVKLKMSKRFGAQKSTNFGDNIICGRCNVPFSKTTRSQEGAIVCSIECLIIYAEQNHQIDLLKLKDGVDLQKHDYTYPLTAQEKIKRRCHKKMKECVDVSKIDDKDSGRAHSLDVGQNPKNSRARSWNEHEDEVVQKMKKRKTDTSRATIVTNSSESKALVGNPNESKFQVPNPSESEATPIANLRENEAILVANPKESKAQVPIPNESEAILELANPSETEATLVANPNESEIAVPNPNESEATLELANLSESEATLTANLNESEANVVVNPNRNVVLHYDYSMIPIAYTNWRLEMMLEIFDI